MYSQQYQDKFNVLYKNCKEDAGHSAHELMAIELSQQQQQHCSTSSSSSCSGYDNANSLLKKQLESGARSTLSPSKQQENCKVPDAEEEENETLINASTSAYSSLIPK